jgi:hypothetical protein
MPIKEARTVALSAATSLLVSTLILVAGFDAMDRSRGREANQPLVNARADLTALEEEAAQEESPIINVVTQAEPAVVSVIISKDLPVLERYYEQVPLGDSPFNMRVPRIRQRGTELQQVGGGTAFFV